MRSSQCGAVLTVMAMVVAAAGGASRAADAVRLRVSAPIYLDANGSGLLRPEAVAYGPKVGLVVADTGNGRLVRYAITGQTASAVGEFRLREVPHPIRVSVEPGGGILVLDGKSRRIARVGTTGNFQGYLNLDGAAGDRPVVPRSLAVDADGTIYVLDVSGGRILAVETDGSVRREIGFPEGIGFLSDLAVSSGGDVYAVDSTGRRVFVARGGETALAPLTESLAEDLDFPTAIAVDGAGRLFLADQNGGGIVVLGQDGAFRGRQSTMGWSAGRLRYPTGLCSNGASELFVADRENNRVQVFSVVE